MSIYFEQEPLEDQNRQAIEIALAYARALSTRDSEGAVQVLAQLQPDQITAALAAMGTFMGFALDAGMVDRSQFFAQLEQAVHSRHIQGDS